MLPTPTGMCLEFWLRDTEICEVLWMKSFGCLCADSGCLASVSSQNESLYFSASLILAEGDLDNGPEPSKWVQEVPNTSVACYISILCSAVRPATVCDEHIPVPVTARWGPLPTSVPGIWAQRGQKSPYFRKMSVCCPDSIGMALGQNIKVHMWLPTEARIWAPLTVPCRCRGRKDAPVFLDELISTLGGGLTESLGDLIFILRAHALFFFYSIWSCICWFWICLLERTGLPVLVIVSQALNTVFGT